MGKNNSQPATPNPYQVAQAQTGQNIGTATANSFMANPSIIGPTGSSIIQQTGGQRLTIDGKAYDIPTFTQFNTLAEPEQRLLNQQRALGSSLNDLGLSQVNRVGHILGSPMNLEGLPSGGALPDSVSLGNVDLTSTAPMQYANSGFAEVGGPHRSIGLDRTATDFGPAGPIRDGVNLGRADSGFAEVGGPHRSIGLGRAATDFGPAGPIRDGVNLGRADSGFAEVGGPHRSIGLGRAATDFGPAGPIRDRIAGAGPIQGNVGMDRAATRFGDVAPVQRSIGPTDYSADRQRVEEAILSRLNPQIERDRAALENRLINQGFARGTEAFNNEMDALNRQSTDARMQAILAGGGEQSRLAGLDLAKGQFANTAQGQEFGQQQARGAFQQAGTGANNAAALEAARFANTAQGQQWGQNEADARFANAAQQQGFAQQQARGMFGLQATGQNNAAALSEGNFANAAQQQAYEQALGRGSFARESLDANNRAALAETEAANAAQQQGFAQQQARGMFGLQATGQNNAATLAAGNFANDAQRAAFEQALARGSFANEAAAANNQANLAFTRAENDARAQERGFNNAAEMQRFDAMMQLASAQNTNRDRALQERLLPRTTALNEIGALMNGGSVSLPQFTNFTPGQVANTDLMGAVYNSAALDNQNYQTRMNQQNAIYGALGGLGGAALGGATRGMFGMGGMFGRKAA